MSNENFKITIEVGLDENIGYYNYIKVVLKESENEEKREHEENLMKDENYKEKTLN